MAKLLISSYEEADKKLLELSRIEAGLAKKEADLNSRIQSLKEKYDAETADVRAQKNLIEQDIQAFCLQNKADFLKQRTKKLVHGVIGFRTNPPKVNILNRKFTTKTVLEFLKKLFEDRYVRMKEEIDKESILADYSQGIIDDSKLAGVGLRVDQDETFTYEIDWESLQSEGLKQVS